MGKTPLLRRAAFGFCVWLRFLRHDDLSGVALGPVTGVVDRDDVDFHGGSAGQAGEGVFAFGHAGVHLQGVGIGAYGLLEDAVAFGAAACRRFPCIFPRSGASVELRIYSLFPVAFGNDPRRAPPPLRLRPTPISCLTRFELPIQEWLYSTKMLLTSKDDALNINP